MKTKLILAYYSVRSALYDVAISFWQSVCWYAAHIRHWLHKHTM